MQEYITTNWFPVNTSGFPLKHVYLYQNEAIQRLLLNMRLSYALSCLWIFHTMI